MGDTSEKEIRAAASAAEKARDRLFRVRKRAKATATRSAEQARDRAARVTARAKNAAARSAKKTRDGAARVVGEAKDAAGWSAEKVRGGTARMTDGAMGAANWSAEKARIGATRIAFGAKDAAGRSAEKARVGAAHVADGVKDAAGWSAEKARTGTAQVTDGVKDAATWSAEKARVGATHISEGAKDVAARSAEKTRAGTAQVADGVKDAATWSAEKARVGATHISEGAKDVAARSAEKTRHGAAQVAGGVKDGAAWSAEKARQGATAGLSVTRSYGAPVITGVTAGVLAVSEKVRTTASFQKMLGVMREPMPFLDVHGHLSRFSLNLDWANVDPNKYLYAGTRGASRGLVEAQRVWETIPEQIRAAGPEATAKHLEGKDWSHIHAYSEGGSHRASNGLFEEATLNRARGSDRMTPKELEAAQRVLKSNAFHATLLETAKCAMEGALTAAAIAAVMAVLEYGLQYQRREITEKDLYRAIGKSVMAAGISGAAVSGLLAAMAMAFPATVPVISSLLIPLMVIGFSVLGFRLARLGKGWYEFYLSEQPLRPLALQYWLADQARATAKYIGGLTRWRLAEEAER